MSDPSALQASDLPLPVLRRGKVREVYDASEGRVLLVASDRVSAFDVVLPNAIPFKGAVLTQLTAWWLRAIEEAGVVAHHMLTADADAIVAAVPALAGREHDLHGRAMLCRAADVFPVECVVRGYLAGSAWKEYSQHGTLAGEPLAPGLRESDRLEPALFSPATKAESGHDENISPAVVAERLGTDVAAALERASRAIYAFGGEHARTCGLVIADTKFEFGRVGSDIVLIDEVLTPDSSRFWPADVVVPGSAPPSFDKQPLRDWLAAERTAGRWNGDAPGPELPREVVEATSARYLEAFRRITGQPLDLATPLWTRRPAVPPSHPAAP